MFPIISFTLKNRFTISCNNFEHITFANMAANMRRHISDLKLQRMKKNKNMKFTPSTAYLQLIGTGAKGAPRSLYLFTDNTKYLFNCGEGTQRLAHEHKIKISLLEHVFITYPSWENIGGLPGMALTIQECGVPDLYLHGPHGLSELFAATSKFVVLNFLSVKMVPCSLNSEYSDKGITINYVPLIAKSLVNAEKVTYNELLIKPPDLSQALIDNCDYYSYLKKNRSPNRTSPTRVYRNELFPNAGPGASLVAMTYICRLKPKVGMLDLEACVEHGVPPGPLLGQLKAGKSVTLENGKVIHADDVTSMDEPGPVFIVVECPSTDFLESLTSSNRFEAYQANAKKPEDIAYVVVHFTPPHVMEDAIYQEWMKRFSEKTKHIYANGYNTCLGSAAVHEAQHELHLLEPNIFPLLKDDSIPVVKRYDFSSNPAENVSFDDVAEQQLRLIDAPITVVKKFSDSEVASPVSHTLRTILLRPNEWNMNRPSCVDIDPDYFIYNVMKVPGFLEELAELKKNLAQLENTEKGTCADYPKICFLGTGSSVPNKTRNTSAILLTMSCDSHILIDCGESTYNQIVRFFGASDSDRILADMRAIFISHLHADHHIGLIALLKARRAAVRNLGRKVDKLLLIAPIQMLSWLSEYHRKFEHVLDDFVLVPNTDLLDYKWLKQKQYENLEVVSSFLNMKQIVTCVVNHCPNSFGIAFTHPDGWKITYSGDTMPCPALVHIGKDSDLLIHEATMEDELIDEARYKLHSTTSQALSVGKEMNAKFMLLTHFSQRYAKLPRIDESFFFNMNLGIAYDNMIITFQDLKKLPLLYSPLKVMYAEHCEEIDFKAFKRKRRLEIIDKMSEIE